MNETNGKGGVIRYGLSAALARFGAVAQTENGDQCLRIFIEYPMDDSSGVLVPFWRSRGVGRHEERDETVILSTVFIACVPQDISAKIVAMAQDGCEFEFRKYGVGRVNGEDRVPGAIQRAQSGMNIK